MAINNIQSAPILGAPKKAVITKTAIGFLGYHGLTTNQNAKPVRIAESKNQ
jgi:hypothetical protein